MKFTFFGHSCFMLEWDEFKILFDPFISPNPLAADVDIDAIQADYILVSHAHEDHTADLERLAKQTGATIISNFEICNWTEKKGCDKYHPMNFGTTQMPFGTLSMVPAKHSSSFGDGSYGGNPGGFILQTTKGNIYYSGDTSLTMDMLLVPRYAEIDVAILPIGGNFTMNVEEALIANEMIKANKVVGVHFDTFGYIEIDKQKALDIFAPSGTELIIPEIGQIIHF